MVISFLSFFEFFFGLQIQLNWGVNLSENDHREPSPMIKNKYAEGVRPNFGAKRD